MRVAELDVTNQAYYYSPVCRPVRLGREGESPNVTRGATGCCQYKRSRCTPYCRETSLHKNDCVSEANERQTHSALVKTLGAILYHFRP